MEDDADDSAGSITLIGSVHLSETYFEHVKQTVLEAEPDVVAVELDQRRLRGLFDDSASTLTPRHIFKEFSPMAGVLYFGLSRMQKHIAESIGLDPGVNDMRVAVETAARTESKVALIDRDINVTLERLANNVTPLTIYRVWKRSKTVDDSEYPADSVQELLDTVDTGDTNAFIEYRDLIEQLIPEFADAFVHERDRIMARRLYTLEQDGHDVVAVVGGAHEPGIRDELDRLRENNAEPMESPTVRPVLRK